MRFQSTRWNGESRCIKKVYIFLEGGDMGLALTLPSKNKTSAIAVKNYPKEDITFLVLNKFASFF